MSKTVIYLVRHGQSLGNEQRIYLGHTDLDLSALGYKQAESTAKRLASVKIDSIYSSDLLRAHNTALPHAEMRGLKVIDSRELREIYLGDWEGTPIDVLVNEHYEQFVLGWKNNFGVFTLPNGESVLCAAARFENEVLRISKENIGKTVLITAHAAVIRAFWCKINGVDPSNMASAYNFPANASFSIAEYDGERLIPISYSDNQHIVEESLTEAKRET